MKSADSNIHQCLSLREIKSYLEQDVTAQERLVCEEHFSACDLCEEVKNSFSTVGDLEVEEDIAELKDKIYSRTSVKSNATRRLFLSRVAAGILLPVTGLAAFFYWNSGKNERLFQNNYQTYEILGGITRGPETYDNISLPKDYQNALQLYQTGKYAESIPYFRNYRQINSQNTYANFIHALAHLEIGNWQQAAYLLEEVRTNDSDRYADATWYLALLRLKQNEVTTAKNLLNTIKEDDFYGLKAKELLDKM